MNRIVLILIVLITSGCTNFNAKHIDLYEIYLDLAKAVEESDIIEQRSRYFTKSYLNEVDVNDEKSLFN